MHEDEVPEIIMSRLSCWDFVVWFRFDRMYNIDKLDAILDEEDRNIISHDIPITLICVEFDREASHISYSISTPTTTLNGGEAQKDGSGSRCVSQNSGGRYILKTFIEFEVTMGCSSSCMYNTFRNSLMIEAMNLRKSEKRA